MAWVGPIATVLRRKPRKGLAWLIAMGLFAVCLLLRLALDPWLAGAVFLTFYPAIVASTLISGWRAGVVVTLLSLVAGWFFLEPRGSFALFGTNTPIVLGGFLLVALFQVALVAALTDVVRRLDAAYAMHGELFSELQHRVANNMQLIASTLGIALRNVQDPAGREAIAQATARVAAMAQLHRKLYDPESYKEGLEPVLREVLADTFQDLPVTIDLRLSPLPLSISQMTAITLLVNEAAINAAKHVFRPALGNAFEVMVQPWDGGQVRLMVRDDGPGLGPVPPAVEAPRRLGMAIMQSLARQLGGSLELIEGRGMALGVTFAPN